MSIDHIKTGDINIIGSDTIDSLVKVLRLRKPGRVFIKLLSRMEKGMLNFVLVLPPKGAPDVVTRMVTLQVGTQEVVTVEVDGETLETEEFSGNDNDPVVGSLVDVDDAGNHSEPRDFDFVLLDTIPPPQPGEVGLEVRSET